MKKSGKFKTILFGLWVIVVTLLIQAGELIVIAIRTLVSTHGNVDIFYKEFIAFLADANNTRIITLITTLFYIVLGTIWYYNGYYKKKPNAEKLKNLIDLVKNKYTVIFIIAGIISTHSLATFIQVMVCQMSSNSNEYYKTLMNMALGGNEVIAIISTALLAPIAEELLFRGIVLERAKRSFGAVGCIALTAVIFALYHMNLIQGVYVLPLGIFTGYVAYKYNSIILPIIVHMLNNILGIIIASIIDKANTMMLVCYLAVGGICVAVMIICNRKSNSQP